MTGHFINTLEKPHCASIYSKGSSCFLLFSCASCTVCPSRGLDLENVSFTFPLVPIVKLKVLLRWFSPAVSIQMEVLHLLSPEQKAQLMLYPETAGLNNDSLSMVLGSLMSSLTPSGDVNAFNGTMWNAGFPVMYSSTPQDPLTQVRLRLNLFNKLL